MKLLLIVGVANDIFIYNYAKWLRKSMDVSIDVFEFYPSTKQGYSYEHYDSVSTAKSCSIPIVNRYFDPYIQYYSLNRYIREKKYDVIHCHWVVSPVVLTKGLKKHCKKLIITFWGGEFERQRILGSNCRYRRKLNEFSKDVDAIINSKEAVCIYKEKLSLFKGLTYNATLGSAPLEALYELMNKEDRIQSKESLNISTEKVSVLIGYSGKVIHQHIPIISKLKEYPELKEKLHLLLPMTRGANEKYNVKVKEELEKSGFTYTLFCGRFLSDNEIARIRNATDIALQLSTIDGFSRSVVECFCAKSIVIYGNWLGYEKYLNASGFNGICVKSIEEGILEISGIIKRLDSFLPMTQSNYEKGKKQNLWSTCIRDWVKAYNDLL